MQSSTVTIQAIAIRNTRKKHFPRVLSTPKMSQKLVVNPLLLIFNENGFGKYNYVPVNPFDFPSLPHLHQVPLVFLKLCKKNRAFRV